MAFFSPTVKPKLYVGVCGHRDLKKSRIKAYKKRFVFVLEELRDLAQKEGKELILVTPLAEGADRLAAEAALELGIRYDVLLPMPLIAYIEDFDDDSFEAFEALMQSARDSEALACDPEQEGRDACYERLGRALVDRCERMIFLFDGNTALPKPGGTADVLAYARVRGKPFFVLPVERETLS
jgi:hypothetical protein